MAKSLNRMLELNIFLTILIKKYFKTVFINKKLNFKYLL
ncbi:Uncharacterised protein [Sphingobacterium daejeonense]|nr:Uncharacterised protein [Sphingobacterium daejeonense]